MSHLNHDLTFTHRRNDLTVRLGSAPADSTVTVDATSYDLTEAWRELLSRLPNDTYAALKAAMAGIVETAS